MNTPTRAGSAWLALREPADAAARSADLVAMLQSALGSAGRLAVHDLGCGTGSMTRWLAAQLIGPQHWVLHDRDVELLALATELPPGTAADGAPVTLETRRSDITRLAPRELAGADLITASALLDVLTAAQIERFVDSCVRPGCPTLVTLSVTGRVHLVPADPLDEVIAEAFNAHQRRGSGAHRLLGPDALDAAVTAFSRRGAEVTVRRSPWRLGPARAALTLAWLTGWLAAAHGQRPELAALTRAYTQRRREEAAAGQLAVTVHHEDLLVHTA